MMEPYPEHVRTICPKGRVCLPPDLAAHFGAFARLRLLPNGIVLIEPAARGTALTPTAPGEASRRVTVPKEFRRPTGIKPGAEVRLAGVGVGVGVVVWALPEARVRLPLAAGVGSGETR
jgi:hypothetical protein